MVIPFRQCIARPTENSQQFLLTDHLIAVATQCGLAQGAIEQQLAFLAGLLHDVAKSQYDWQKYANGVLPKGPPHAPLGAALFAYFAEQLISLGSIARKEKEQLADLALDWIMAVYNHHGKLDDLDDLPPWEKYVSIEQISKQIDQCDQIGLMQFINSYFPNLDFQKEKFVDWLESYSDTWERRVKIGRSNLLRENKLKLLSGADYSLAAFRLPKVVAPLIKADRYHAGGFESSLLTNQQSTRAIEHLKIDCAERAEKALAERADPRIVKKRIEIQQEASLNYVKNSDASFFTLLLPTGFGKTLTSLRIALEACRNGRYKRIVYVAPYLSILSQSVLEINRATGLEVFQHHHLTLAEMADDSDVDVLDTWQAPIIATTFNQFFRALFPSRAQECLRIEALHNSFIIIDEPQIIDVKIWNLFLRGLAAVVRDWDCQVLFATATLPMLSSGLGHDAIPLAPATESIGRYDIYYEDQARTVSALVDILLALKNRNESIAIIMNNIADAVQLYTALKNTEKFSNLHCLTACMLPAHKTAKIKSIREELKSGKPSIVICTQILEAGVDLSFQRIFRALPILPSIAQAAGRANRHGEGQRASIVVFPFVRDDGKESRHYVYRDATARRQTDSLLSAHNKIGEERVTDLLATYFHGCWDENKHEAGLIKFEWAAQGKWSELSGLEPFDSSEPEAEVFVPADKVALSESMLNLMKYFNIDGPEQILFKYQYRDFRRSLGFLQRKRFLALLRQFMVPVSNKIIEQIANPVENCEWIHHITNIDTYSLETGLAHLLIKETEPKFSSLIF